MANQGERKTRGLVWMCVAYVVATVVGLWVAERGPWPEDLLWQVALADLVATLVIFGFSVALNNSSLYDPYWSVAPMVMALYWGLRFIGDFFTSWFCSYSYGHGGFVSRGIFGEVGLDCIMRIGGMYASRKDWQALLVMSFGGFISFLLSLCFLE